MYDKESRRIIEALRSGVPSRAVGQYFSEARPGIMKEISGRMDAVCEQGSSCGMVISGKSARIYRRAGKGGKSWNAQYMGGPGRE